MRLVAYLRVSTEGQLDGYGIDVQRTAVRKWAKANGHRIVLWCADEGVSGTLDVSERPGLAEALDTVAEHGAEGIVTARLDRLARALTVQEAVLAAAWKLGGRVFTADAGEVQQDDPDDPMRTALRQIVGVIAQLDRALVAKRLRDGRRAKAEAGGKATGDYRFGTRAVGKGRDRDAGVDEAERLTIARMLELRRSGASYRDIAAALDAEGLPPRRAAKWSAMAVRNIVSRELASCGSRIVGTSEAG